MKLKFQPTSHYKVLSERINVNTLVGFAGGPPRGSILTPSSKSQATGEQLSTLVFSEATETRVPLDIERSKKRKVIKQDYIKRERTPGSLYKFIRSGVFEKTTPSK